MQQQGSVGRRLDAAFDAFNKREYENCLVQLFPALDKTAKKRRPGAKVGVRICKFLEENEDLLSYIATNGGILMDIHIGDMTVPKAIYLYGRCPIAHEGELDPRLQITEGTKLMFGSNWIFPTSYIFALIIAIMAAEENADEFLSQDLHLNFNNKEFLANQIWGQSNYVREAIGLNDRLRVH
ncbi:MULTISPECIES: hypothetical protein [Citrobacter freundii complex]|uniref:hypothetical protein n=1 Tax=Citrobacter freundii complex TaxID=1344959 RepID=UPI001BCC53B9|nr:hypothetical protein [Citrobacter freundii]MDT7445572.1 hypothetical protein [Citrobacter freundii]